MSALSTDNANDLMQKMFGGVAIPSRTSPATWYLALCITTPTAGVPGIEASGLGYARVPVTNDQVTGFNAPVAGAVQNKSQILFPQAGADWSALAPIVAVQWYDALVAGAAGPWDVIPGAEQKPIYSGDQAVFQPMSITTTMVL